MEKEKLEKIKNLIRDIPDFPVKGILFRDGFPLAGHEAFWDGNQSGRPGCGWRERESVHAGKG